MWKIFPAHLQRPSKKQLWLSDMLFIHQLHHRQSCCQEGQAAKLLLKSQCTKIAILYMAKNTERAQVQMHIQMWLCFLY